MKFRIAGVALALLVFGLVSQSHACDCTLPQNYGNSQCRAAITAALNAKPGTNNANTNNNSNGQGQTQGQGQTLNSSIGVGASSTVGDTSATGGKATGGSVGNTTSTSQGGNSVSNAAGGNGGAGGNATGGKGGKASSASNSTSAGGSVSGVSSASSTGAINNASNATGGTSGVNTSETNSGNTNIAASRIPVNTAIAGFQMTTAPCRYAEGLGIQTMPAGGAVGFTFKDHDCMKLGLAQEFYAQHQFEAGDRTMCAIKEVHSVLGSDCLTILAAGHVAPPVVVLAPTVTERTYTRTEVDAIVKKVVSK